MPDKDKQKSAVRWIENPDKIGERLFTFDGERVFNLFRDYPHALTPDQKAAFDAENPFWAAFFQDRTES